MKKIFFTLLFTCLISPIFIYAQTNILKKENIFGDARIDSFRKYLPIAQLVTHYPEGFSAYRIQVLSTNKKQKAIDISQDMGLLVPDLKIHIVYREPYYRVRVGVFKSESEAEPYRKKIDTYYKNRYSVITLPEIIPLKECLENFTKDKNYDDFFRPLPIIDTSSESFIY